MPVRTWLLIAAVGSSLAALAALAQEPFELLPAERHSSEAEDNSSGRGNGYNQTSRDFQNSTQPYAPSRVRIEGFVETVPYESIPQNHVNYTNCSYQTVEECDLTAQQAMASATDWMNRAAWFGVLLTVVGLILIAKTMIYTKDAASYAKTASGHASEAVEQARRANELQQSLFFEDQRAWVEVEKIIPPHPLRWNKEHRTGLVPVGIFLRNRGKTIAKNVSIDVRVVVGFHTDFIMLLKEMKDAAKMQINNFNSVTIFASATHIAGFDVQINSEQMQSYSDWLPDLSGEEPLDPWTSKVSTPIMVLLCVTYTTSFSDAPYQTSGIYDLHRDWRKGGCMGPYFGDTPQEELSFSISVYEHTAD